MTSRVCACAIDRNEDTGYGPVTMCGVESESESDDESDYGVYKIEVSGEARRASR